MPTGYLEHVNITVSDPEATASLLQKLTGWRRRWEGPAMSGGRTIHLGTDQSYVALYTNPQVRGEFTKGSPMNHVGVVVDDLVAAEAIVVEEGLEPFNHGDYEPGRRFYFFDRDHIEWEIVSYE